MHIVQNIVSATFVPVGGGSNISPVTIEAAGVRDSSGHNTVGFDNEGSFRHFPKPFQGSISLKFADPLEATKLVNQRGNTAVIVYADQLGGSNIAATLTNWSFTQAGNDESFANIIAFDIEGMVGSISYAAV